MTRFLADEHVRVLRQEAERTRSCIPRSSRTPAGRRAAPVARPSSI